MFIMMQLVALLSRVGIIRFIGENAVDTLFEDILQLIARILAKLRFRLFIPLCFLFYSA